MQVNVIMGCSDAYANGTALRSSYSGSTSSVKTYTLANLVSAANLTGGVHLANILANGKAPTRSGYTFVEWYVEWTSGTTRVGSARISAANSNTTTVPSGYDYTITANWKANVTTPTVNPKTIYLYPQGGSISTGASSVQTTVTINGSYAWHGFYLPSCSMSGYTFTGWNTKSDGSGYPYSANYQYNNISESAVPSTLYAQYSSNSTGNENWGGTSGGGTTTTPTTPTTHTIILHANGGTGGPVSATATKTSSGYTFTITSNPTKSGYTFSHWNTNASGSGTSYYNNVSNATDNNPPSVLYAIYKASTFTVNYNASPGTNAPSSTTATSISAGVVQFTVSNTIPTYSGYKFLGWRNAASTATYDAGKTYTAQATGNFTLYAVWEFDSSAQQFTVHFRSSKSGVTGSDPASVTAVYGTKITLPACPYTLNGYNFNGWGFTSSATSGLAVGSQVPVTGNLTFYAIWTLKPDVYVNITFKGNGGYIGSEATYTVPYQQTKKYEYLPEPQREGHNFLGWYTAASNGTQITSESICNGAITLYAHWTPIPINKPTIYISPTKVKRGNSYRVTWLLSQINVDPTYKLEVKYTNGSWQTVSGFTNTKETSTTFTASGTFLGAQYRVTASANGVSQTSDVATVEVDKGSAPVRPPNCTVSSLENDTTVILTNGKASNFDVAWETTTDPDQDLAGYQLQFQTNQNTTWRSPSTTANAIAKSKTNMQFPVSLVRGCQWVKFRIRAYDDFTQYSDWRESNECSVKALTPPYWANGGWVKAPEPQSDPEYQVHEGSKFTVQWDFAQDLDSDLVGYTLERCDDGVSWGNKVTILAKNVTTRYPEYETSINSPSILRIQYRVQAYDSSQQTSDYIYSEIITVIHNTPPQAPEYVEPKAYLDDPDAVPRPTLHGGAYNTICWAKAYDQEDNVVGYELDCSFDGRVYQTIKGFDEGDFLLALEYNHLIPRTPSEQFDTVSYRVRAIDVYGEISPYRYSKYIYNISNNSVPTVSGSYSNGLYAGVFEDPFPINYLVEDEEGDPVNILVQVLMNGVPIKTLDQILGAETPYNGEYIMTPKEFSELPMARLAIRVTATDNSGSGIYEFEFTRKGTRAYVSLAEPLRYPDPINTVQFTHFEGHFPNDCSVTVEVTNNANDPHGGIWEEVTPYALNGYEYQFTNTIAVYGWAFNFRATFNRGASGESGYVSRIAGFFDTPGGSVEFGEEEDNE